MKSLWKIKLVKVMSCRVGKLTRLDQVIHDRNGQEQGTLNMDNIELKHVVSKIYAATD